ncbi:alpha/beta hydrolase [Atlantibacter sp.]|uniref:alpha/beta hydrolase n=1 Tax=Atlantibacter sp. TaxID=1903473 RepID=UPI0028A9676C|nr:alpha/beta hydrolase [Atlantibacter sp.]
MPLRLLTPRYYLLISLMFLLAGCVNSGSRDRAALLAKKSGLNTRDLQTTSFKLRSWQRISDPTQPVQVYIEGDGFAWVSRSRPSDDPTPRQPTGLMLAAADTSANVLYLARPCQFIGPPLPANCRATWWTDNRFSPQVVQAMNEALSQALRPWPDVRIELVGYSGGGAIAALIAARRDDVISLRTVAGNLDVAYVNAAHNVSAMPDALSALDVARQLANLPQIHFTGSDDTTVPPEAARRFQQAAGGRCVHIEDVKGMAHGSDWAAVWPSLLQQQPDCR